MPGTVSRIARVAGRADPRGEFGGARGGRLSVAAGAGARAGIRCGFRDRWDARARAADAAGPPAAFRDLFSARRRVPPRDRTGRRSGGHVRLLGVANQARRGPRIRSRRLVSPVALFQRALVAAGGREIMITAEALRGVILRPGRMSTGTKNPP